MPEEVMKILEPKTLLELEEEQKLEMQETEKRYRKDEQKVEVSDKMLWHLKHKPYAL